MAKTIKMDFSGERLLPIASEMLDDHNYIGALKILAKCRQDFLYDEVLAMRAGIYDDLGLYEECINAWFAYLDRVDGLADLTECYEGIAVSYMNLGADHFAAYYYNKLLAETGEVDADEREQLIKDFLAEEENPLKFAYPPEIADCSQNVSDGIDLMKAGEYDKAIEEFDKISEKNPRYSEARNYVAMCHIIGERLDLAQAECENVLKKKPDDVQALTTLSACKAEAGQIEEACALAHRLIALGVSEPEDIYKIATVCCENGMHAEAYSLFCKLTGEGTYDKNLMYFRAVSAYNCGKVKESFNEFDKLLTVYPDAVVARYYYDLLRDAADGERQELSYFYRLPQELRESSLKILAVYMQFSQKTAKTFAKQVDLTFCIKWCFDENEGSGAAELQRLGAHCAIKAGMDDIVRNLLLNAFISDELKIELITALAERNRGISVGFVLCSIFKKIEIRAIEVGRSKRSLFVSAYSRLAAHFGVLNGKNVGVFADTAEYLYESLCMRGMLDAVKDTDVLSAAVYQLSGVREAGVAGDKIYSFFEVDEKKVKKLLG